MPHWIVWISPEFYFIQLEFITFTAVRTYQTGKNIKLWTITCSESFIFMNGSASPFSFTLTKFEIMLPLANFSELLRLWLIVKSNHNSYQKQFIINFFSYLFKKKEYELINKHLNKNTTCKRSKRQEHGRAIFILLNIFYNIFQFKICEVSHILFNSKFIY